MKKRFIVALPKKVSLITEEELHILLSLNSVSNMVIIDRNNLKNVSFNMCTDVLTKCIHRPITYMIGMEVLKCYFDNKDFQGIDNLLTGIIE